MWGGVICLEMYVRDSENKKIFLEKLVCKDVSLLRSQSICLSSIILSKIISIQTIRYNNKKQLEKLIDFSKHFMLCVNQFTSVMKLCREANFNQV